MLQKEQHKIILWSVREGKLLEEAVDWCRVHGLEFYAVNRDYPEETTNNNPHFSRKVKADIFIDDRNLGGLPDWGTIYQMITHHQKWHDIIEERAAELNSELSKAPQKKHWWNL